MAVVLQVHCERCGSELLTKLEQRDGEGIMLTVKPCGPCVADRAEELDNALYGPLDLVDVAHAACGLGRAA